MERAYIVKVELDNVSAQAVTHMAEVIMVELEDAGIPVYDVQPWSAPTQQGGLNVNTDQNQYNIPGQLQSGSNPLF